MDEILQHPETGKLLMKLFVAASIALALTTSELSGANRTTGELSEGNYSLDAATQAVDQYLDEAIPQLNAPGTAVALVYEGEPVYFRAWGVTGGTVEPVTQNTPFLIGSVSKPLTAWAIQELAAEGRIELDSPISRYLPDFNAQLPNGSPAVLTTRQLLGHTSGISTAAGLRLSDLGAKDKGTLQRIAGELSGTELSFSPGMGHEYSNANYILLGAIIETVSGKAFADYMKESVFEALEMKNAAADAASASAHGWQPGYRSWFGVSVHSDIPYDNSGGPYGYIAASVTDLAEFISKIQRGPASVREKLFTPIGEVGSNAFYGMGWRLAELDGEELYVWHAGANADFRAEIAMLPERKWAFIIVTNRNNTLEEIRVSQVVMGVRDILRGKQSTQPEFTTSPLRWAFSSLLFALALLCVWLSWRLFRRVPSKHPMVWFAVALALVASAIGFIPIVASSVGVGWRTIRLFVPDLAIVSMGIAGLLAVAAVLAATQPLRKS